MTKQRIKIKKKKKRCKYQTISEMVAMVERDHILVGTKYAIDYIELDRSVSHQTQRLDQSYFLSQMKFYDSNNFIFVL